MADVGSIVKVSGSRIATPLGPPRPGSTPTKMPSVSPTIISASVFQVSRTANRGEQSSHGSISKQGFKRPLRHDDVERNIKSNKHGRREHKSGQQ